MSRFTKEYHEEVARLLKLHLTREDQDIATRTPGGQAIACLALDFAGIFAADNPRLCAYHGEHDTAYSEDCKITGFDREQFLTVCGLEGKN